MTQEAWSALAEHGTATVSDALDLAGVSGGLWGPRRLSGAGMVVGPAFTVRFEPVAAGERAAAADYLDEVPPGSVVVISNDGRHCTVWGDILAEAATARGLAGSVIDGYCRDIDRTREIGYSMWALGTFMRSGKNRVRMVARQVPVEVGADGDRITVHPGDIVCADGSGVVVVPSGLLPEIVDTVARVAAMERRVLADLHAGVPLREARATNGYHLVARKVTAAP